MLPRINELELARSSSDAKSTSSLIGAANWKETVVELCAFFACAFAGSVTSFDLEFCYGLRMSFCKHVSRVMP
jgi:hypothetical protein